MLNVDFSNLDKGIVLLFDPYAYLEHVREVRNYQVIIKNPKLEKRYISVVVLDNVSPDCINWDSIIENVKAQYNDNLLVLSDLEGNIL